MQRRDFLSSTCLLCAGLGAGSLSALLESCSSLPVIEATPVGNTLTLPAAMIGVGETRIVQIKDSPYTIAVHRKDSADVAALLLRCTHADNRLDYTGSGFACNLHGSRFDLEGAPVKGPAVRPLKTYPASVVGDTIVISLAG